MYKAMIARASFGDHDNRDVLESIRRLRYGEVTFGCLKQYLGRNATLNSGPRRLAHIIRMLCTYFRALAEGSFHNKSPIHSLNILNCL